MFGKREFVLLFAFSSFLVAQSASQDSDYLKGFLDGVRELEKQSKHIEDLLTGASSPVGSREEIEEDKGPADGSASQEDSKESTTKKQEAEQTESEDDDSDDDFGIIPVRGIDSLESLFGNFPNLFGIAQPKSWWSGPNVCVEREEKEDKSDEDSGDTGFISFGTAHFSSCHNSPDKYSCRTVTKKSGVTKTVIVSYQCCHGFRRTAANPGCTKVETKSIPEIAVEIGAEKFADMIRSAGLEKELDSNVTVFFPMDEAVSSHQADFMESLNQVDPVLTNEVPSGSQSGIRGEAGLVLGHVVEGVYESSDFTDEMVLKTKDNSTLRINFFPNRMITVNCAQVNTTDRLTDKGVVHLVDSVLTPVKTNLAEKLSEPRFSKFKQLLEDNFLWDIMSEEKPLTVFAVENEAVEKIEKKHQLCMKNILSHQILPHTVCSAVAGPSRLATLDLAGSWLPILKKDEDIIVGNSSKITSPDLLATNGLVHVIDSFAIPSSARSISELLEQTNHTSWKKVLERSGLLEEMETTPNVTMFVPLNPAVDSWLSSGGTERSLQEIQDIVKYHIGTKQEGNSIQTQLPGKNLTVSLIKSMFSGLMGISPGTTVQCAALTRTGGKVCNGVLHEISSVVKPPSQSIWEFIQEQGQLTTFRELLQGTELEKSLKDGLGDQTVTLLAPSNEAFSRLPEDKLEELKTDKTSADQLLRAHILNDVVCCTNVGQSSWPFVSTVETLGGKILEVNRRPGSNVSFGSALVQTCDITLTDGIAHIVDAVYLSKQRDRDRDRELVLRSPNSDIILAGI